MQDVFLVLVRCGMDDLPVAILGDGIDAILMADLIKPECSQMIGTYLAATNCPTPSVFHAVDVIRYSAGDPVEIVHHRNLDD